MALRKVADGHEVETPRGKIVARQVLLEAFLACAISMSIGMHADRVRILIGAICVPVTVMRDDPQEAVDRFPNNTHGRMIDSVKLLTAPEVVADVQSFFAAHPIEQAAKTLEQILESQRVNAAFRDRDAAAFESMLLAEST